MTFPTAEDIKLTDGEEDPVFNGIFIETGCNCDGYNCNTNVGCKSKKESLKQQILSEHEIVERLKKEIDDIECSFDVGMEEVLKLLKSILENKPQ